MKKRILFIVVGLLLCVSALAFTQLLSDNSGVSYRYDAGHHRPYKIYNALLTQTGTDAPVATVLENTLGGTIVWTRANVGIYLGTLSGVFAQEKTGLFIQVGGALKAAGGLDRYEGIYWEDVNSIRVSTWGDQFGSYADLDALLLFTMVEIRVYK